MTKKKNSEAESAQEVTEKVVEAAEKPVEPETKAEEKEPEKKTRCYIGPSVRGILQPGTIYIGDLPRHVEKELEKVPELKTLIVDIDRLPQAQNELLDPRSGLAVLYKQAAAKAAERK